jgi:hypothetical protein
VSLAVVPWAAVTDESEVTELAVELPPPCSGIVGSNVPGGGDIVVATIKGSVAPVASECGPEMVAASGASMTAAFSIAPAVVSSGVSVVEDMMVDRRIR